MASAIAMMAPPALADGATFLEGLHNQIAVASTIPQNGDLNPYAIVVAPAAAGRIQRGDVLVGNFNDRNNLQGLGTTIIQYRPGAGRPTLFASAPRHLPECPGGVGLTTAMTMLKSGYVVVGSMPSLDGTTTSKGDGCLLVFDAEGKLVRTIVSPHINGPWGNMAVIDRGRTATLLVTNTGFGVESPGQDPVKKANVVRIELALPVRGAPVVTGETVIAEGFQEQPDKDVFVIGPTGLALDRNGTLYVSDALGNSVDAIPNALTRRTSAGTGKEITKDGLLTRPLAMATAPNGNLLVLNGQDGKVVEIDPKSGKQLVARWIDVNRAQSPPGNGDLFGLAMTLDGSGFYYVEDDVNQLVLAR
jgi:sugar lactone lactonase YvrE